MRTIEAQSVTKVYDGKKVVDDVSLRVACGEAFVLMGPNGAGKTTLLKLLGMLEKPTSGRILLDGVDVNDGKSGWLALKRRIAMVFQRTLLFDGSVAYNVEYGLRLRGVGKEEVGRRVEEALSRLGLTTLRKRHISTLSGGEAQRVALAQVMALKPEVLLLDEPTANLDPANSKLIEELLFKVREEGSTAIVMATHNVFQAKRLADTFAFMLEGSLAKTGRPSEVLEASDDATVTRFLRGELLY